MSGRREGGYTLVVLVVAIAVLNVGVAAALPVWSTVTQRDKEEELIFRGLQYAEAIRVFLERHGRFPATLDELIEVEPRSIRRLWEDPMTDDGRWGVLVASGRTAGARRIPYQPVPPRVEGLPGGGETVVTGPIVGVYSTSTERARRLFMDRSQYDQWHFSINLLLMPHTLSPERSFPRLNAGFIGRPVRQGVTVPADAPIGHTVPPREEDDDDPFGLPRRR